MSFLLFSHPLILLLILEGISAYGFMLIYAAEFYLTKDTLANTHVELTIGL